ncbi:MAG: FliH/SctL family protein [Clostridiaceae bacterium]|nr:FliH/SctL family protein [Clostridiaceae bacterium]
MTRVVKARYVQIGRAAEVLYQAENELSQPILSGTLPESLPPAQKVPSADEEAGQILANARAQAEILLADAKAQAAKLYAQAREQGYAEGQKGAIESAHLEIGETVNEISALLHSLEEQKTGMLKNYEGKIRDLAIHIAKKVVQAELNNNSEMFLNIYKSAVQELRDQEWIKLSVSDLQVQFATENADFLMSLVKGAKHIEIEGLPEAPTGTCIVETPDGIVDASLDTQMDRIKEAFADVEIFLDTAPDTEELFAEREEKH